MKTSYLVCRHKTHVVERHMKRREDGDPERSTQFIDLAVAGKARRFGMGIMILPHGLAMTGGEFLWYALVRGTAVQMGL